MISTAEYTESVGYRHRKRLAQFFTPPEIARFMVGWVLGGDGEKAVHDPAFGLGAFFDAAPDGCCFTGCDIDPAVLGFFDERSTRRPARLECRDYLLDFGKKLPNVVCNPPYMRFQKFTNRDAVSDAFRDRLGIRLSGYTNTASAFLVKSLAELAPGGRLAYVMPTEFLNCGYGKPVKERLLAGRHLVSLLELECEREAFGEVTTSVCIVLYDSSATVEAVGFRRVSSLSGLNRDARNTPVRAVPVESLDPGAKWGAWFPGSAAGPAPNRAALTSISHYGRFSRGIATGANGFFVLKKSQAEANGIPPAALADCITKSQQLKAPVFSDADFARLSDEDAPVHLFAPGTHPDPASMEYIRKGESLGFDKGYITRHRNPWYATESRGVSPLLLNVFSRDGYKVVRNYSGALTLTNFHCFYPHPARKKYVDWLFLYLHSGVGRRLLSPSKRKYGNSLDKFEPGDLNGAAAPKREFFDAIGDGARDELMRAVRAGEDVDKRLDSVFGPLLAEGGGEKSTEIEQCGPCDFACPDEPCQLLLAMEKGGRYRSSPGERAAAVELAGDMP